MTRSRPFRAHCVYCLAVDVELERDVNSFTGAVTMWCADVCLQALLEMDLELRAALLDEAREDDEYCGAYRQTDTGIPSIPWETEMWPLGAALDELRLIERRIFQLREELSR